MHRPDPLEPLWDAVVVVSPDGEVWFWSEGAQALFGYPAEDAVGRQLVALIVPNEDRAAELARLRAGARAPTYPALRRTRDGERVTVDVSIEVIEEAPGTVHHLVVSMKHTIPQELDSLSCTAALLSILRVDQTALAPTHLDLSAAVRLAVARCRAADGDRAVQVEIAGPLWVWADPLLIDLLIQALVENAWKFTRGKAVARIAFGAAVIDGTCTFFVSDDGAGFDPAGTDRLFSPFQRLHPPNVFRGLGTGLARARRIVERHGGRIWATGRVEEGATVFFTLPEVAPEAWGEA